MIKDSKGSQDGWYWAEMWDAQCVDNNNPPFAVPYAGFALYCVRCHASAEKEHTFTYLTSNLQTKGTSIEDWKFPIATASEVATMR